MSAITSNMAVIIDNLPETTIDDYIKGLVDIVGAAKITHASRIAGGRICAFLTTEDAVKEVTAEGFLSVKDQYVPIRRYNTTATKIILSNVFPFITNEQLASQLRKYGTLTAPIRDLTTGSKIGQCSHIKSFRKIAYVLIKDIATVPDTLSFDIDGNKITVYLSMDEVVCMKCRTRGHIAKYCKAQPPTAPILINTLASSDSFPPLIIRPPSQQQYPSFADAVSNQNTVKPLSPPPTVLSNLDDRGKTQDPFSVTTLRVTGLNPQQRIDAYNKATPSVSGIVDPVDVVVADSRNTQENETEIISSTPDLNKSTPQISPSPIFERVNSRKLSDGEIKPKRLRVQNDDEQSDCESVASMGSVVSITEGMMTDLSQTDPEKDLTSSNSATIMPPDKLKEFLKKTRHFKKILPLVKLYTTDPLALSAELENYVQKHKDINIKRRLSRIITAIASETQ